MVPGLIELNRRGHDVRLLCEEAQLPAMGAAGINAEAVDPAIAEVEVTDYQASNGKERLVRGMTDLMKRGRLEGPDIGAAIARIEPDLLLVDSFNFGAVTRAEASGLPWAMFTGGLLPIKGKGIPPLGLGLKPMRGPLGRVRDNLLWKVSEKIYGNALLPGLNELRSDAGLSTLKSPFELLAKPDAFLVASERPLEYPRVDLPANVTFVGPQTWDPPAETPTWLDEPGEPWVLVTCSTDYQGDETLAINAEEALSDLPFRVLITVGDGFDGSPPVPTGNARFERFVPHGPVLERAAAVICHGGMGIVQKSLCHGLPVLVVPFGRDQPEVARRVTEAGVGRSLSPSKADPSRLRQEFLKTVGMAERTKAIGERFKEAAATGRFADTLEELSG